MVKSVALSMCLLASSSAFMPSGPARATSFLRAVDEVTPPAEAVAPAPAPSPPKFDVRDMAGVASFPGFFDPLGLSGVSEARIKYFREAELKHSRIAMLAAPGFIIAEFFHPLFGGNINVPSYVAFQQTPLQNFWPVVVGYIGVIEIFSVATFASPFDGAFWTLKPERIPGDFNFDPAGIAPKGKAEMKEMQTKELNNGRLAMLGIAGMVAQELVSGSKIF